MKYLIILVGLIVILNIIGGSDDGLTQKQKHDRDYATNKANATKYEADCYRGNERACEIVAYSMKEINKYKVTYPSK